MVSVRGFIKTLSFDSGFRLFLSASRATSTAGLKNLPELVASPENDERARMFNTVLCVEHERNPAANKSQTTFAPTRRRKAVICPNEKRAAVAEKSHDLLALLPASRRRFSRAVVTPYGRFR